jgi:hypothetical protein
LNSAVITVLFLSLAASGDEPQVRIAVFEADVTPPIGSPLCDGLVMPAKEIVDPLTARGIVILTNESPIVLCSLDWVGIGNGGHRAFRQALAEAAGTTVERVCVHCTHAHDAPGCDFDAEEILKPLGLGGKLFDPAFAREAIRRTAQSVKQSMRSPRVVDRIGVGKAKVDEVASNRRVPGPDGKVKYVRYSATKDAKIRAEPEGLIDAFVRTIGFYAGESPVAVLTYYATHPQSYYGKGGVSCDFPGIARSLRTREAPGAFHVHFNGAGGNVTAGKYNDGSPSNRMVLAHRLADGMKRAYMAMDFQSVDANAFGFRSRSVALPLSNLYSAKGLESEVKDEARPAAERMKSARNLAWARRCERGDKIDLQCVRIGSAAILHLPGELFVEYQLAAQQMAPNRFVATAAYGDYGMGYIGTAAAYSQGGYETGPVSRVAPEVEAVLTSAMRELLE